MNRMTTSRPAAVRVAGARRGAAIFLLLAAGAALADDAKAPPAQPANPKDATSAPAAKAAATPARTDAAPAPRSLEEALRILQRRRADVDFTDVPLEDVVSFLARVGRINAMVGPVLVAKAQGPLPTVTLKLRDVSMRQFAELVAKSTGTALVVRDGVLQFTTPEDARGTPVLRVISIADLTFRIRNFPGPDIQLHTGDTPNFVQEPETDQEHAFSDPQAIVDLVKKFTGQGTWEDEDVSISADESKLVAKQYPKVIKEIARFLALLRAAK